LASGTEITRAAVSAIRCAADKVAPTEATGSAPDKLFAQAHAPCHRLERALSRIKLPDASPNAMPDLIALCNRVEAITQRWLQGCDRQTPSQAKH
jgi:hypothetical protein